MIMPFGKYRGLDLSDLPLDYLQWLAGRELHPPLRGAVDAELARRSGSKVPAVTFSSTCVDSWYRKAAMRFHPDRGGSQRDMVVVNACRDLFLEAVSHSAQ